MSTSRYRYKTDKSNIFNARTDNDEGLDEIRGAEPQGQVTEELTFEFSKNTLEVGCKPRHFVLSRAMEGGAAANCLQNDSKRFKFVICLSPEHFNSVAIGSEVECKGQTYTVQRRVAEQMR